MKKTLIALAALASLSGLAQAQSNVTVYGVLDEAVRFNNHSNANSNKQTQLVNGLESESRVGLKGSEDLGNGLKAIFNVEAGVSLGSGNNDQDNRFFGRVATVGLSDTKYGTLTLGRQNTLAHDFDIGTDVYNYGSATLSGYKGVLTGVRHDSSVKYTNTYGVVSYGLDYGFGNQTGDNTSNSSYGASLGYNNGPVDVRAVYQRTHDTLDGTPGTFVGQDQRLAAIGGSYDFGSTKLFGQYWNNKFDVTNQQNDIYVIGLSHKLTSNVTAKASYSHDKQENFGAGKRNTVSTVVSYAFSPRTDVYTAVDYNRLSGGYTNTAYALNSAFNPNTNSTAVSLGLRHKF